MGKLFQEFKEFAVKGNVVDMAVGVVIGGAFGKIISSLVADIIMPSISALFGGSNFTEWKWILKNAVMDGETVIKPAISINYGNFIQVAFDFVIIAFTIFLIVKAINKMRRKLEKPKPVEKPAEPVITEDVKLLREIRDLLKKN